MDADASIRLDLHLHSTYSDGFFAPSEILRKAASAGIRLISIADHETAGGYLAAAGSVPGGVELVPGVEFSTYYEMGARGAGHGAADGPHPDGQTGKAPRGRDIHILGYFPCVTGAMQSYLKELQEERLNRAKLALVGLRRAGCELTFEHLMRYVSGDCISRAHVARALVESGQVSSVHEAFNRYLSFEHGLVPRPLLTPARAISFIANEGGIPVWAHPDVGTFDLLLGEFAGCGLKGVEACAGRRGESYSLYFERTAGLLDMFVTYGSDWHGHDGERLEGITVPYAGISRFLDALRRG